jgi:hypothetical protein
MVILNWLLLICIFASLVLSVIFSTKSHRAKAPEVRAHNACWMNIWMGILLILGGLFFQLFFTGSTLKVVIFAIMLLVGLFNLVAGVRQLILMRAYRKV